MRTWSTVARIDLIESRSTNRQPRVVFVPADLCGNNLRRIPYKSQQQQRDVENKLKSHIRFQTKAINARGLWEVHVGN